MVDFEHARRAMVDSQLRTTNVTDRRILAAMGRIPRENFVPEARRPIAYIDESHGFGALAPGRFLPAPSPFAKLVQLAEIGPGDHILDVGAGTGYSTAVLAALGAEVVGVEREAKLVEQARANLASLGIANAKVVEGAHDRAPKGRFDVIVLEGAVTSVPEAFFTSLGEDGRLVALVQTGVTAVAHLFVKAGKTVTSRAEFNANLPPLEAPRPREDFVF
ncbi:protein-L-isoaspartate O-methyltransferase family protein [Devosia nitrariae]|uniref:Protein-L-isoaspartate O-methyltransferase n=1 Tax=Devosia nitrariae TaxID=2071872 RepID=A0ABQ5WDW7_9HYPH|nr:protein-L-isoaspartate O-methyltransferase [Devosia nitrariae]GLQ57908.1 protein-L-isoaspartate O-methyltransferase [Devosia nitrariae]